MTPAEFKAVFPEFTSTSDEAVQLRIDMSEPYFNAARWGSFLSEGVSNFVAHQLALSAQNQATGGISSDTTKKKVGDVEVMSSELMLQRKAENPFLRTIYGQRYLYLLKLVGLGALVA